MTKTKTTDVKLAEREIEKRERLVQTYIVLFGLLLSYGQNFSLQENAMQCFLFFLIMVMIYYVTITCFLNSPVHVSDLKRYLLIVNSLGIVISFLLSYVVSMYCDNFDTSYYLSLTDLYNLLGFWYVLGTVFLFIILTLFLWIPLIITNEMFHK
jgi:hypothetical protein